MGAEGKCWGFKQLCPPHFHCPQEGSLLSGEGENEASAKAEAKEKDI